MSTHALTESLRRLADAHGSQAQLADAAGLVTPTVSWHIRGQREVNPDHLAAYLAAAPASMRRGLLLAWLRAYLPGDLLDDMAAAEPATGSATRARDGGALYRVALQRPDDLDPATASALAWLAQECAADAEMADLLRRLATRWGWEPDSDPDPAP
jgi:hypothetical protein